MIPYKTDTEISSYIIFPRFLIPLDLSNDAKVLYALLLDRAGISRKKGYIETDGTIRLYFTLEDAKAKLRRSRQVATRAFSRAGILRSDLPPETGPRQTCCDYSESAG